MSRQCLQCRLAVRDGGTFCAECGGVLVLRRPAEGPGRRGRRGPAGRQFQDPGRQDNAIYQTFCNGLAMAARRTAGAEPRPAPVAAMACVPG